jgi:hypothetical protein
VPSGVQKRRASSLKSDTRAPRRRINDFQLAIENTSGQTTRFGEADLTD